MMLLPFIIYLLTIFITTIGPGNIAGVALLAPITHGHRGPVRMSAFCMTLIVVGASNSAGLLALCPHGDHLPRPRGKNGFADPRSLRQVHASTRSTGRSTSTPSWPRASPSSPGFLIFGGWKWMMTHKGKTVDINTIAPKPEPFNKQQWFTVVCIITLILLVVVPALPGMKQFFPKWLAPDGLQRRYRRLRAGGPHDALQRGRQQGRRQGACPGSSS